jgi:hypothetical protein
MKTQDHQISTERYASEAGTIGCGGGSSGAHLRLRKEHRRLKPAAKLQSKTFKWIDNTWAKDLRCDTE